MSPGKVMQPSDMEPCAYLDIETTSLSPHNGELTVIGLYLDDGGSSRLIQLVGQEITASALIEPFQQPQTLYTYNGSRFDLPYIQAKLGVDLARNCHHRDLMYDCWRRNLYGGLKEVERKLGISRDSAGIDGRMAVRLWLAYRYYSDERCLMTLLDYNREDVLNLKALRQKLKV